MFTKSLSLVALLACGAAAFGDEVVLTSGEVLKVTNVERHEGRVEMDHPILGHLYVPANMVESIRGTLDGGTAPAPSATVPVALPAPAEKPAAAPGAAPAPGPEEPKWKRRAELGVNGQSGNSRTLDLRAAIGALLETPSERWKFDAAYLKSKSDGEKTVNNWYAQGLHDWLFRESPWLVFATARYDWDEFQEWDTRISLGAGVGYRLIDEKDLKLRLRGGFNETRQSGGPDDGKWTPEGLLGAEANWQINENQALEGAVTYYPDLQDAGEYRVVSTAGWSIKLSANGLSLKIGIEDEYDTHAEDPFKKDDFKYFLALLYEF